jgi:choline dehydrogenase
VVTRARVHRIAIQDGRRATAVEYDVDGLLQHARVRREVVMAAGALETPKLLMLSGLGPSQALRFCDVPVVREIEGIGQNLHDHPNVPLFFVGRKRVDCYYPQLYSFYRTNEDTDLRQGQSDTCYVFWPAPSAMKQAVQRMLPAQVLPEALYGPPLKAVMRGAIELAFAVPAVPKLVDRLYGIVVILGKPYSRGSLRLASKDPLAQATIDPRYFSDARDIETMVKGVHKARGMAKRAGLAAWSSRELMPGPLVRSDAGIAKWIGKNAITTYHFAGTCRMGDDATAPCDARLRLRGLENVRIADASAIPTTPVSALNAPSMLVGLRAAIFANEERRASA